MSNPELSTATADRNKYDVRILIDGDELFLPFAIVAGKDYGMGDLLTDVAKSVARDVMHGKYSPSGDSVEVLIQNTPEEQALACENDPDAEPFTVASAVEYRW